MIEFDILSKLIDGANLVAETVGSTAGPAGKYVLIDDDSHLWPRSTRDGVSVARNIFDRGLDNIGNVEKLGAELIIQASNQQLRAAGDGTTAVTILAAAIATAGMKSVRAGYRVQDIRNQIEKAGHEAISEIKNAAINEFNLGSVLRVACSQDFLVACVVEEVLKKIGINGQVTWEPTGSQASNVFAEYSNGFQWNLGLESGLFCTNRAKNELLYNAPYFLVTDKSIRYVDEISSICGEVSKTGSPLVIVSPDVGGDALPNLVEASMSAIDGKPGFLCCVVKPEGIGSAKNGFLDDLASFTGATLISDDRGIPMRSVKLEHLGRSAKFVSGRYQSCVMEGSGDISSVKESLLIQSKEAKDDYDKELAAKRYARITGGVAVIKVSGPTESEIHERLDRVDDAVRAGKCALESGVVPGGGKAYLIGASGIKGDDEGARIMKEALLAPMRKILNNAGQPADFIIEKIVRGEEAGWDVSTGQFCNMNVNGLIDPVKVSILAINNAISVSSLLLGSGSVIVKNNKGEKSKDDITISERIARSR